MREGNSLENQQAFRSASGVGKCVSEKLQRATHIQDGRGKPDFVVETAIGELVEPHQGCCTVSKGRLRLGCILPGELGIPLALVVAKGSHFQPHSLQYDAKPLQHCTGENIFKRSRLEKWSP